MKLGRAERRTACSVLLIITGLLPGCRQQMAHQPAYRPLEPSPFFADERSARPLVERTVPRGSLHLGSFYTGRRPPAEVAAVKAAAVVANPDTATTAVFAGADADDASYLTVLPFAAERLGPMARRGQQRFNIYCSPCHDRVGTGHGMIVQRGFTPPPSLHTDYSRAFLLRRKEVRLADAPAGYFFEVITNGFGAMPSYRKQISAEDRWAIVAYIRVLQLSQNAKFEDVVDAEERTRLLKMPRPTP